MGKTKGFVSIIFVYPKDKMNHETKYLTFQLSIKLFV